MFGAEQLTSEHMQHELWHEALEIVKELRPYIVAAIVAVGGVVVAVLRKKAKKAKNT